MTPSPVIATTPRPCSARTMRILCSGRPGRPPRCRRAWASSASSPMSSRIRSRSVPVTASPGMPRSAAIAPAVTAWSPVIIRTRMPASRHWAMASRASGRGGSTMPTSATSTIRSSRSIGSAAASTSSVPRTVSGEKSCVPTASTRMPWPASFGVGAGVALPGGVVEVQDLGAAQVAVGAADQHVRRALDEAAHHVPAARSVHRWKVAMNL